MAIRNVTQRNALANAYGTAAPYGCLFTGDPGTADAATGESVGVYVRLAIHAAGATWTSGAAASVITGAPVFSVSAGQTITYAGVAVSSVKTTADVRDSAAVTSQAFASAGTYTVTFTYTQT